VQKVIQNFERQHKFILLIRIDQEFNEKHLYDQNLLKFFTEFKNKIDKKFI